VYHNAKMLIDPIVSTVYRRPRTIQEHVSEPNGYIFDTCRPHSSGTSKADKFVSNYMGPHGNDISDVISSLTELSGIDRGITVPDLSAFYLAFLGDMPQRNEIKGPKGIKMLTAMSCTRM
jgi:hypothetical protein